MTNNKKYNRANQRNQGNLVLNTTTDYTDSPDSIVCKNPVNKNLIREIRVIWCKIEQLITLITLT